MPGSRTSSGFLCRWHLLTGQTTVAVMLSGIWFYIEKTKTLLEVSLQGMIKLIKSTFYKENETKRALTKFINKTKWLSFGPECRKFEDNFAAYQGRKYCVFFNSGSSANLALIQALLNLQQIQKQDKVGFSALTWSTNVMPLIQLGLGLVPIDVELETLNMSSNKLNQTLKKHRLKAVFVTNLLGFCDDIDQIKKLCDKKGIILIEDNCEALGTIYKNKKLGNFGLASTFSFFVGHHMSTIEGGAVCTDNSRLANMLRLVRAHGWDRNLAHNDQEKLRREHEINEFYARYTFYDLSYNLRPTEIHAVIGNIQLKYLNKMLDKRNKNFIKVAGVIYKNTAKYYSIKFDHMDFHSNFAIPIICRSVKIRDELLKKCEGKIEVRPIVGGDITQQPFFKKYLPHHIKNFKNTNADLVHRQGLYIGNNPQLTQKEIKEIIKVLD